MCEVLDKVENKGENKMALLVKNLLNQNRIDDAKRASEDEAYRAKLMEEFGIRYKHPDTTSPLDRCKTMAERALFIALCFFL